MPEAPIDAAHYPGLARLGPLAADIIHRAWVMPPYQSITALVMRELVGKDDLIAAARAQTEEEEVLELTRQAVVAFSTEPVPTRKVVRSVPVRDGEGRPTGAVVDEEVDEPDLDRAEWQMVGEQPFKEFDTWKRVTRKLMVAFYNQLNGIDPVEVGKSLASGRDWSPSTKRTTTAGRHQSQAHPSSSATTAGQRRG